RSLTTLDHTHLHSSPTRRSSDLAAVFGIELQRAFVGGLELVETVGDDGPRLVAGDDRHSVLDLDALEQLVRGVAHERRGGTEDRSEEHTSELQSREKLVCRLLLE